MANTTDFVRRLAKRRGITRAEAAAIIEDILEEFTTVLVAGEALKLRGFGTIEPYRRPARRSYLVHDGSIGVIDAGESVRFRASAQLLRRLARARGLTPIPVAASSFVGKGHQRADGAQRVKRPSGCHNGKKKSAGRT